MAKLSKSKSPSAVEKLLGCGRFQGLTFLCYQWIVFVQAWNMVFMVFGKAMPTRWSYMNSNTTQSDLSQNETKNNLFSCKCLEEADGCKNFTWEGDFYSIVPHWQLVCDRVKIIYFIMTVQMIGVFVGSPIFGQISDSFGRKWTLFGSVATLILFGTLSAFSPNWKVFASARFLVGVNLGGTVTTSHVLLMEMLSQKHRLWVSSIAGWPLAFAFLSLLAYITADWRVLAIVTNLVGLPALGLILFVGESPRWLIQKGKSNLADIQLRRIVRINKTELDEKTLLSVVDNAHHRKEISTDHFPEKVPLTDEKIEKSEQTGQNGSRKYSYWHLFSTKNMAVHTIVLAICYFCTSNVSNGVVFMVDKLSGNLFLNFFILACLRWIANGVTIAADLLINKFGRKIGFVLPFSLISIASAIIVALFITGQHLVSFHTMVSITSLLIAMLCSPIWVMLSLSTSENYPTPIRNIAAAFTATCNRLGSVVVPQFLYLGHFWGPAPYVVFTTFSIVAAVLYGIFIPETKGIALPDQMPIRERLQSITISLRRDSIGAYQPVPLKFMVVNEDDNNDQKLVPDILVMTNK